MYILIFGLALPRTETEIYTVHLEVAILDNLQIKIETSISW